jgi:hypothetical protein
MEQGFHKGTRKYFRVPALSTAGYFYYYIRTDSAKDFPAYAVTGWEKSGETAGSGACRPGHTIPVLDQANRTALRCIKKGP